LNVTEQYLRQINSKRTNTLYEIYMHVIASDTSAHDIYLKSY
jgi:hypothetical protein